MKNKYIGVTISDIHCGALNAERLNNEFTNIFLRHIENMKQLDYIIVCGDFFHRKLFLNDTHSTLAYKFLSEIMRISKEKDSVVRFVYGTESHECEQYDILTEIKNTENVKIIKHVMEEELLPGMRVLYIPEESIMNKEEYYKDYFNEPLKYDYVFGHGVIREVMKEAAVISDNSSSNHRKVPVFSSAELGRITKGQVYFGHYHVNTEITDNIFYIGSFSRWVFGEETRKGFYEMTMDIDNGTYKNCFIENTLAEQYTTIGYGYDSNIYKSVDSMCDSLDHVEKLINTNALDHVRFEFNIPEDCENPEFIINYVNEKYKFNDKVKINIVHGYIEEKKKKQKEEVQEMNDKYAFIFDKNMELGDKCSLFITIEYNATVSPEHCALYLYKPLPEILSQIQEEMKDTSDEEE